jgi:hypothetical protein
MRAFAIALAALLALPGFADKVSIEGKDFADALFSVWLGAHPVDDALRNEMFRNR